MKKGTISCSSIRNTWLNFWGRTKHHNLASRLKQRCEIAKKGTISCSSIKNTSLDLKCNNILNIIIKWCAHTYDQYICIYLTRVYQHVTNLHDCWTLTMFIMSKVKASRVNISTKTKSCIPTSLLLEHNHYKVTRKTVVITMQKQWHISI